MGPGGFPPCVDCSSAGNKPVIECAGKQQYGLDSVVLNFSFCDNNGDIGLGMSDTTGIFKYGNIWAIYFYKDSIGNWVTGDDPSTPQMDTLILKYRIPPLPPPPITTPYVVGGFPNPVKVILNSVNANTGEIQCMIKPLVFPHNEIRFDIFMYDKALNKTNIITTPSIYP